MKHTVYCGAEEKDHKPLSCQIKSRLHVLHSKSPFAIKIFMQGHKSAEQPAMQELRRGLLFLPALSSKAIVPVMSALHVSDTAAVTSNDLPGLTITGKHVLLEVRRTLPVLLPVSRTAGQQHKQKHRSHRLTSAGRNTTPVE